MAKQHGAEDNQLPSWYWETYKWTLVHLHAPYTPFHVCNFHLFNHNLEILGKSGFSKETKVCLLKSLTIFFHINLIPSSYNLEISHTISSE